MLKTLIGLLALGIVVIVHELGHFIAARLSKVDVESFSIGWGPVLLRKKIGRTEYRLSALPLGGYCGMKGEHAFQEALEKGLTDIPREKGSFFGASALARAFIALAGPLANLAFAFVALALVHGIGFSYDTYDNRVIPAYLYDAAAANTPAARAGLLEGDRILSVSGKRIDTYSDLLDAVGTRPNESLDLVVERGESQVAISVKANLDKKSGTGKIGVYPYVPLVVGEVVPGSPAEAAELKAGDLVVSVDGKPVAHSVAFSRALDAKPEQVSLVVVRNGIEVASTLVVLYEKDGVPRTGLSWRPITVHSPKLSFSESLRKGATETVRMITLTAKSVGLLFKGVDLGEAVSGPLRITQMIGDVAQTGFSRGILQGFVGTAEFLSIICVSLFLMNLLPIPILDGGTVLISFVEIVTRRRLRPKTLYYVQFVGVAFIACVFVLALVGDIRFLMK